MNDTPGYVKNLKKESVVQSVINCLTDAMRNKELKPGDRIPPEPELAASMGVARSSVREAIKILSYLGVLESKRSEGTFVCSGFQESMIDPMIYGIILNQDSFDNLMELREMVETGIMRLASQKYDEEDGHALEAMLEKMKEIVHSGDNEVDRFFAVDNEFHDLISQMGKNPLADKISRVVRTLTHAVRYETVSTMITSGRGDELVAAHSKLLEILRGHEGEDVEEIVRGTYFGDIIHGEDATAGLFDGKSIVSLMEFVRFAEISLFFSLNLRDTVIKKMTAAHPAMTNREEGRRCPMKTVPYSPLPRRCGCLTC